MLKSCHDCVVLSTAYQILLYPSTTLTGRTGSEKITPVESEKEQGKSLNNFAMGAPLHRADGSATATANGYTVVGAVNGPLEVQRRDELPEEAAIEVNIRPAIGVASTAPPVLLCLKACVGCGC